MIEEVLPQDIKSWVSSIEKLKSARTLQQYTQIMESLSKLTNALCWVEVESLQIAVNFVVNHKQYPEEVLLEIKRFLQTVIQFIVMQPESLKLSEMLRMILDPVRLIYEYNGQSTDVHQFYLTRLNIEVPQTELVDAIRTDKVTKRQCWGRAKILEKQDEELIVRFLYDNEYRKLPKHEIAAFELFSTKRDRIRQLSEGDCVMVTQTDRWLPATITKVIQSKNEYDEEIIHYDLLLNNGQTDLLSALDPRLSLTGRTIDVTSVDDSLDELYDCNLFATLRPKHTKSTLFVDLVNHFGAVGGFEKPFNCESLDVMANIVKAIGNMHAQLRAQFVKEYVPRLTTAIREKLLSANEQSIRNMGKEKIHQIVEACTALLDRVGDQLKQQTWMQQLCLDFVIVCFNCDFLDKKIMALKLLTDMVKQAFTDNALQGQATILQWISEQQFLDRLLSTETHLQVLSRANDLIRLLIQYDRISEHHLTKLWNLTQKDDNELRPIIFKLVSDVAVSMNPNQIRFFLDVITAIPIKFLFIEHIQLIYDLNYITKHQELLFAAINILWRIVEYHSQFNGFRDKPNKNKDMEEKARGYICELIKDLDSRDLKINMVNDLVNNIKNGQVESSSLKTISTILSTLPTKDNPFCQEHLVDLLCENQVTDIVLASMLRFKASVAEMEKPKEWPVDLQAGYMNKMQERILLVKAMVRISKKPSRVISDKFLDSIWRELVLNPLCKAECDMTSSWIRDLIEKENDPQFLPTLKHFFDHNFQEENTAVLITENAFDCFQALMLQDNEIKKTQQIVNGVTCTYNQQGKVTQMTNAPVEEVEVDFSVGDLNRLNGLQYLWAVVYLNTVSNSLQEKAANLLVKLHLKSIDSQQAIATLIDKVILNLTLNSQSTLRSLLLLRTLLNQSEIYGIGSLVSLGGLTKAETITINLQHESLDSSKKTSIKVPSNITIMDLRLTIAQVYKMPWAQIKISRANVFNSNRDISDQDNGKTIQQIGIKKSESLIISKRKCPIQSQVPLIENGQLVEQFRIIVDKVFDQYSTNGKMNPEQASKFIAYAASDVCTLQDTRVLELFTLYDMDQDKLLDRTEFHKFYIDSCNTTLVAVWKNLAVFGYDNQLQDLSSRQQVPINEKSLPRFILSNHETFFEKMFSLLKSECGQECWRILNILPASEKVKESILRHDPFRLDEHYYLLYTLKIVEYLLANNVQWRSEFILKGGFAQLVHISSQLGIDGILAQIQLFILTIVQSYLCAATNRPEVFEMQRYCKQPLKTTIDTIAQAIEGTSKDQEVVALRTRVQETEEAKELRLSLSDLERSNILGIPIMDQLIKFIITLAASPTEYEQKLLIEMSLVIITILLVADPQTSFLYIEHPQLKEMISKVLFLSQNQVIRKTHSNTIYIQFKFVPHISSKLLNLLFEVFPEKENKETTQYFDVLCKIISEIQPDPYKYHELAQKLMIQIKEYQPQETRSSPHNDKTLCGYLQLVEALVKVQPGLITHEFAQYLFSVCLFCVSVTLPDITNPQLLQEYDIPNYVKCKSVDSRKSAYSLLQEYSKQNAQRFFDILDLHQVISLITPVPNLQHRPQHEIKHYQGYVGIRNLGNICYMNAMLQQFFMTEEFRYAIMRASDGVEVQIKEHISKDQKYVLDDNIIHQFRRLLCYLELSDRPDRNPFQFCFSYKDWDGLPVNVCIQQDSQEFLNAFFERIETGLKKTGWHQIIEGVFGGKTANQIICQGCQFTSTNEELFFSLSVQVKGVKSLQESLDSLTAGETIAGYFCENCKTRNDIIKRQCIGQLPNVLIVHLNRIVFNLDLDMNEKLATKLEFPHQLNLAKYCTTQDSAEYKLKGVVIHKGTALAGHYYSLINYKQDKWMKFNDSQIEEFDIKKLPQEAFGGESEDSWLEKSSTNAYILVYDKIHKHDIPLHFQDEKQKDELLSTFQIQNQSLDVMLSYSALTKYIPHDLYQEIWWDNHAFMFEKHVYCEDFFKFVYSIYSNLPFPDDFKRGVDHKDLYYGIYINYSNISQVDQSIYQKALKDLIYMVTEIISRSYECHYIKEYIGLIKDIINLIPLQAYNLLTSMIIHKEQRIMQVVIQSPDPSVRSSVLQVILHLLNVSTYIHALQLDLNLLLLETDESTVQVSQEVMKFLIMMLHKLGNDVAKHYTKFNQYFEFWREWIKNNIQFASQMQLISVFLDFFMEKGSPLWSVAEPSPININFGDKPFTMSNKIAPAFFSPLLQCVAYMLENPEYVKSKNDLDCLASPFFYSKSISECHDADALKSIIFYSFENEDVTRILCDVLLQAITKATFETVTAYLLQAEAFLLQEDHLANSRLEWFLGFPHMKQCSQTISDQSMLFPVLVPLTDTSAQSILDLIIQNKRRHENYTLLLLKFILKICSASVKAFAYIAAMQPSSYVDSKFIDWIPQFLQNYEKETEMYPNNNVLFFDRHKEINETYELWTTFQQRCDDFTRQESQVQEQKGKMEVIQPLYILGGLIREQIIQEVEVADNVILQTVEEIRYICQSLPQQNPNTNAQFPTAALYDHQFLQCAKINPKSSIWKIVQRNSSTIPRPPPLPLSKPEFVSDGINFNPSITDQKANEEFCKEISDFATELDGIGETPEGQPVIVPELIDVEIDTQENPFIRRFVVKNTGKSTIFFQFSIQVDSDEFVNFRYYIIQIRYPLKVIKTIAPNSEVTILQIHKTVAELDWGLYSESCIVTSDDYQQAPQVQNKQAKKVTIDEEVQVYPSQAYGPHLPPTEDTQIECPFCTFIQSSSNHFCQMCTSAFK